MTQPFETLTLRHATPADLSAVDMLLARSYPRLLAADYPPSIIVLAVPMLTRARPELLASGRYWLAEDAAGHLLGAGGWSARVPASGGGGWPDRQGRVMAQVRHVATDPDALRRGVGRAVMARVMAEARAAGFAGMECLATRTAVPFYAAVGFRAVGPVEVNLAPGIEFPVVKMACDLV